MAIDIRQTALTRARYDRLAPVYDLMEALIEQFSFHRWRERLWSRVRGERILEVGVGTGKNMPYYPSQAQVTAIDLSEKMLAQARKRAQQLGLEDETAVFYGFYEFYVVRDEEPVGELDVNGYSGQVWYKDWGVPQRSVQNLVP